MKFLKIIVSVLKKWKVLLTLGSLLGFAYCGFLEQGLNERALFSSSYPEDTKTERYYSTSRGSGGSRNYRKLTVEKQSDSDLDIDVDDYLEQVAWLYIVAGKCGQSSQITTFKPCFLNCLTNSETNAALQTCITACKTASNTCDYAGVTTGSGVFSATDKVLTNHHVIEKILTYTKDSKHYFSISALAENYEGNRQFVDSIEWHNADSDVAMVELADDIDGAEEVTLGSLDDVSLLSPVFTIGNPLSLQWIAAQGYITGYARSSKRHTGWSQNHGDIYHSIRTFRGNSGGGLFDLESGDLIGLHKASHNDRDYTASEVTAINTRRKKKVLHVDDDANIQTYGIGTHIDRIKELIDSNGGNGGQTGPPGNTQTQSHFEDMSDNERRQAYDRIVEFIMDNHERRD